MMGTFNPTSHDRPYQATPIPASRPNRPGGSASSPAALLVRHALVALLWSSSALLAACSDSSTEPGPDALPDADPQPQADASVDAVPPEPPQPWLITKRLQAPEAREGGYFGEAVAIQGNIALATAPSHGRMYLYQRTNGVWSWDTPLILTAPQVAVPFGFGESVVINDDTIAAAARYQPHGVGASGSVFLFMYIPGSPTPWQRVAEIKPTSVTTFREFGTAIAMDGNVLVAAESPSANPPRVFVFEKNVQGWEQTAVLVPEGNGASTLQFGEAVAVTGNTIFVGVPGDDYTGRDTGAVYVYRKQPEGWVKHQTLYGERHTYGDRFGYQMSASGDSVAIASYQSSHTMALSGRVYVFDRGADGNWTQSAVLASDTDAQNDDGFGASVSLKGDNLMIGSRMDYQVEAVMGAAYTFERTNGEWRKTAKLIPYEGGQEYDYTGNSCAVDGDTGIVGAHRARDYGNYTGAVYVVERNPAAQQ